MITDGIHIYKATDGGYWKRQRPVAPRPQHVCALPEVPEGVAVESKWVCSTCETEWTLRWIDDGSRYPGDRAAANTPHRYGPDGSLWIAFGRKNKRRLKRKGAYYE